MPCSYVFEFINLVNAYVFVGGDVVLPRLSPLDAVVVTIALDDLSLFVLRLACSTPPLRGFFVVEDRLLRERRLGWNKVRTPQL
jgi:hypothetical protein